MMRGRSPWSAGGSHLVKLPPRRRRLGGFQYRPDLLARQVGDVRYGVLVRRAVGREVAKVRNVRDEPAVAFAVDRRPVSDPVHALASSCVDTRSPSIVPGSAGSRQNRAAGVKTSIARIALRTKHRALN